MTNYIAFAISFLVGLLYFRVLFLIIPDYFKKPFTRTKTKMQVHHLHFGIVFTIFATFVLLAIGTHISVFILLGLGLGQIIDDFIASILIPGDRPVELKIYKEVAPHTIILGICILLIGFLLTILFNA
jgi:hypothetical protein